MRSYKDLETLNLKTLRSFLKIENSSSLTSFPGSKISKSNNASLLLTVSSSYQQFEKKPMKSFVREQISTINQFVKSNPKVRPNDGLPKFLF